MQLPDMIETSVKSERGTLFLLFGEYNRLSRRPGHFQLQLQVATELTPVISHTTPVTNLFEG